MSTKARFVLLSLFGLVVLIALLGGIKFLQIRAMISAGKAMVLPPTAVATGVAETQNWQPTLTAIGTVTAVQGVTLSTEASGLVKTIRFESGVLVKEGDVLVELDSSTEQAQVRASEATADLAAINLRRARELRGNNTISQSDLDAAESQARKADADVENLRALIAKKTLRAPFSGRLGIRQVNLGQYLNAGTPIVSLQSMDPVYVSFRLPQQEIAGVNPGLKVQVSADVRPGQPFPGEVTALASEVDEATRNIEIQATLPNPEGVLRPGMFVNVSLLLTEQRRVLAVPATAVLYASYGNSVYVVEKAPQGDGLVVSQKIVRLGETRGDFVEIVSGLEAGAQVVTDGAFKLRPGASVSLHNDRALKPELAPKPGNT